MLTAGTGNHVDSFTVYLDVNVAVSHQLGFPTSLFHLLYYLTRRVPDVLRLFVMAEECEHREDGRSSDGKVPQEVQVAVVSIDGLTRLFLFIKVFKRVWLDHDWLLGDCSGGRLSLLGHVAMHLIFLLERNGRSESFTIVILALCRVECVAIPIIHLAFFQPLHLASEENLSQVFLLAPLLLCKVAPLGFFPSPLDALEITQLRVQVIATLVLCLLGELF